MEFTSKWLGSVMDPSSTWPPISRMTSATRSKDIATLGVSAYSLNKSSMVKPSSAGLTMTSVSDMCERSF
jgi:hypothetical protein